MSDLTHHPECWRDPKHHACAVREVERLKPLGLQDGDPVTPARVHRLIRTDPVAYAAYTVARTDMRAEVERLREALEEIARQRTRAETVEEYGEEAGDFEEAYDAIVMVARRALGKVEEDRPDA